MSGPGPDDDASQRPTAIQPAAGLHQHLDLAHHPESAPFQSQLDYLNQTHPSHPFDMRAMAGALHFAGQDPSQPMSSPSQFQSSQQPMYLQQQQQQPPPPPPQFADPTMLARVQQQQFIGGPCYGGPGYIQRQQGYPMQSQIPFSQMDPYAFAAMSPISPMGPGIGPQPHMMVHGGMAPNLSQFARRGSAAEPAPIPNFPRGPPRKPKQSGHALWVGNLPPAAIVVDLKDHFSRDATKDIESVFLIAKSNCAFVNYRTEAACVAAMNRFHDSRFHGVRLVCRLRRGTASSPTATPPDEPNESSTSTLSPAPGLEPVDGLLSPTIARSQSDQSAPSRQSGQSGQSGLSGQSPNSLSPPAFAPAPDSGEKVPEKYFIVKSLTAQDLEASLRNGIWATQSHNETSLNEAYEHADNVYLIFSANKSGEYFGYARMASTISGEPISLTSASAAEDTPPDSAGSPQSIPTAATATAPKGRIIDDSARGTIFWEADLSEDDTGSPSKAGSSGQNWGKQFAIEWLSTVRLPFYRTRGLRNPWNANREVKIARDGTELEPSVGRRLVQMFHRPSPQPSTVVVGVPPGSYR